MKLELIGAGVALLAVAYFATRQANDSTDGEAIDGSTDDEPGILESAQATAEGAMNRILGYAAAGLDVSPAGEALVKAFESCKLQRYRLDGEKGWTIGWGRFFPDSGPECPAVISQAQADAWFTEDIEARAAKWVRAYVTAPVTQSQFDALASMAYNMSPGSFKTIATAVNNGADVEAAALVYTRPGSEYEKGLRRRRGQEMALYRAEGIAA